MDTLMDNSLPIIKLKQPPKEFNGKKARAKIKRLHQFALESRIRKKKQKELAAQRESSFLTDGNVTTAQRTAIQAAQRDSSHLTDANVSTAHKTTVQAAQRESGLLTDKNVTTAQKIVVQAAQREISLLTDKNVENVTTVQKAVASTQVCVRTCSKATQVNLYDLNSKLDKNKIIFCSTDHYETVKTTSALTTRERRIIDLVHFFNELKNANNHGSKTGCSLNSIIIVCENRFGLVSQYSLKCMKCNFLKKIRSEASNKRTNVNFDFISAMQDIECTFTYINELLEKMHLPSLNLSDYLKICKQISGRKEKEASYSLEYLKKKPVKRVIYQTYVSSRPEKKKKKHKPQNVSISVIKSEMSPVTYQKFTSSAPNESRKLEEVNHLDDLLIQEQFEIKEENAFEDENTFEDENEFEAILPDMPIFETSVNKMIMDQEYLISDRIKIEQEIDTDLNDDERVCFNDKESMGSFDNRLFKKAKVVTHECAVGIEENPFKLTENKAEQQLYGLKDRVLGSKGMITIENGKGIDLNHEIKSGNVTDNQQMPYVSEKNSFHLSIQRMLALVHSVKENNSLEQHFESNRLLTGTSATNIIGGNHMHLTPAEHLPKSNRYSSMIGQKKHPYIAARSQGFTKAAPMPQTSFAVQQNTGESSHELLHLSSFANNCASSNDILSDIMQTTYMPAGPTAVQPSQSSLDVVPNASESSYTSLTPVSKFL